MTDERHIRECTYQGGPCICDRLRACERRCDAKRHAEVKAWAALSRDNFDSGYAAGVQAARDAVEELGKRHPKWDLMSTHYEDCWKHHSECALTLALAAIDGILQGGTDGE